MIYLLIGHRGVGKSHFLENIRKLELARCFDLDQEIERRVGRSIAEIFKSGESEFRQLEQEILLKLVGENKNLSQLTVIALGAGYLGTIPESARVVWIRRTTDSHGRSFLNRPRLSADVSPIEEYFERYEVRTGRYAGQAHIQILLPEGYDIGMEPWLFGKVALDKPHVTTVLSHHLTNWTMFKSLRQPQEILELRDDLLSPEQVALIQNTWPVERILYSHRNAGRRASLPSEIKIDWPFEFGEPPSQVHSISLHERGDSLSQTLERFTPHEFRAQVLKLAVEISDFSELLEGHRWWMQSPKKRNFLPRSPNGRWQWYRQLFGPSMPLHFVREDDGSALDQPTLWQTLFATRLKKKFAAILGHPVCHSRTPCEQRDFFTEKSMPVVAIELKESEWDQAFPILIELGLTAAAVTSPLKHRAFAVCDSATDEALHVEAVNTLLVHDGKISGHNTDVIALKKLGAEMPSQNIWLWGGGGVKTSVRAAWPGIYEISARNGVDANAASPDILIWAVGRSREFKYPPAHVRPKLVLDLNYSDDSPGLEWAVQENLPYQSGLRMFHLQAEAQREFWSRTERVEPRHTKFPIRS